MIYSVCKVTPKGIVGCRPRIRISSIPYILTVKKGSPHSYYRFTSLHRPRAFPLDVKICITLTYVIPFSFF